MAIKIYELCAADEAVLFSPHCWKTRMSLAHKGIDHESSATPFSKVAGIENGAGRRVPVIRDGGTVVEESFAIAKYLDETYPDAPHLVGGVAGASLTSLIINWSQTQVHPAVVKLCLMDIYNTLAPADQEHFRTTREKMFGKSLEEFQAQFDMQDYSGLKAALLPLELTLKGQNFIGGETPLFADYVVFGPLQWLRVVKGIDAIPLEGKVAEWFNTLLDMYGGMARSTPLAQPAAAA
ncbi:MAG: glutathione S-transferase N-terminal domain-containing protein [Ahrensia sp.]|nr:glutathione S-transferase N-terminal domain-containing protein [Ahrensia sp.]